MKRNEIDKIIEANKRKRTATIEGFIKWMEGVIRDRQITKGMWFWTGNGNSKARAKKEDYYYRNEELEMTGLTISYFRQISMSCQNVYTDERLRGILDGEKIKITVADLNKLIDGFTEIVESRKAKAA